MQSKNSNGIRKNKRMGIGDGGNGTWTAQHNQKKEIVILRTRNGKKKEILWRKKPGSLARHYTGSKKTRETKDAFDGQHGRMDRNAV